ncbi:MAG: MnmC family methyltransferase, partial [Methanothermobacter sp.]
IHGAITEAYEKFVKPSQLEDKRNIKVLDICSGLGYNSAALIDHIEADNIIIHMIEASPEVIGAGVLVPSPIPSHEIIKRAYEEWLIRNGWARFQMVSTKIPDNISIKVFCEDARKILPSLPQGYYDAIFLDAFSPYRSPELYSLEFILELARVIKDDGILTTYTSAAPVRSAMIEAGFHICEGPRFGRKRGGTIASLKPMRESLSWDDERMIALTDVGIPYRDPNLEDNREKIIERRENERMLVRNATRLPSSYRTPIYLGRELPEKHAMRILKNLKRMGIPDTFSKEALYIICPQYPECICGCKSLRLSSSRERILEMRNRLEKVDNGECIFCSK